MLKVKMLKATIVSGVVALSAVVVVAADWFGVLEVERGKRVVVVFVSAAVVVDVVLVINLCTRMVLGVEEDELVPDFRMLNDRKKFWTMAGVVVVVVTAALTRFVEVTNVRVTVDGNRPYLN